MSNRNHNSACAQVVATKKHNRTKLIKFRVTADEIDMIDTAAAGRQMDRSGWLRHASKLQAARELSYRPPPPLQLDPRDVAAARQATITDAMEG